MIHKFVRLSYILISIAIMTGCQTSSSSKTTAIGSSGSPSSEADFDRRKAAATRLSAGLQYLQNGNLQNAKRHLDRALELGADSGNVHFGLAYYYEKVKENKKAEKSYNKALSIEPKNPDFMNGYASFLCGKKDYKKAAKYFDKAIEQPIYADIVSAFMNAGVCAKRAGDKNKAASYFRKALNRDSKLPVALIEMAEVEYEKKRYERAYKYIKRFEAVSRPSANSLWLALRVAHFRKDKNGISSYAIKLERIFPDSDETANYLDNQDQWK